MLVGPSKCLKQIIQIKHNRVKNSNSNQLAIYNIGRGFELAVTVGYHEQSSKRSEWDLKWRPPNYKSSALTTQPR